MFKYSNLVTILDTNSPQHKSWLLDENNEYKLIDKKFSKYFSFKEVAISDIYDLHSLVEKYAYKKNSCFIRGKITEHAYYEQLKGYKIRRVINEKLENNILVKKTICDYPKKWLMLDIDNFPAPKGIDINLSTHRENAVEKFISTLHESFHNSSYVCQFSNGMLLGSKNIKAHLWFVLSESYDCKTLQPWFEKECRGVDKCVFRPAQLLYTSNPVFENSCDPLGNTRIYLKEKEKNTVELPKSSIIEEYLSLRD